MKIHHITCADDNMTISANVCVKSAIENGCFSAIPYRILDDITQGFFNLNKDILSQPRGVGYWLWKPYFIVEHMKLFRRKTDDIIIYTDAGIKFENQVSLLINSMDSDIMLFGNRWRHGDWCKMDCLLAMNCNRPEFESHEQLQASCIIVKNTQHAFDFMQSWLEWCQVPGMINDSESITQNREGFREHRHDQAILTNLALLEGLTFHWWPAQYSLRYKGNYKDNYPVMFQHHRKRNNEW